MLVDLETGLSDVGEIVDRGPFIKNRCLDVSRGIATRLHFKQKGVTELWVFPLDYLFPEAVDSMAKDSEAFYPREVGLLSGLP